MSHYIHHVPGRLRIKTLNLKRNEAKAMQVCRLLRRTDGVENCEVKTLTGSIVISYDGDITNAKQLINMLKEHGIIAEFSDYESTDTQNSENIASRTISTATGNVGKVILGFVVEKAVERSAVALIGALL